MSTGLVVALIVVPVVAGVLSSALAFGGRRGGWQLATVSLVFTVWIAFALAGQIDRDGALSYAVGGFALPFGIELVADGLAIVICLITAIVSVGAIAYTRRDERSNHFFSVFLFLMSGIFGIAVAGDLFTMYVFFEITGLAAYALVASGHGGGAAYAAFKYLILGTVGATLFLFGVAYLYVVTGALNIADVSGRVMAVGYDDGLVLVGAVFLLVGLALKIPLVPLHSWLPDAHSRAPPAVSAVISALVTAVAAYALARVLFSVFTVEFFSVVPTVRWAILVLASASVLVGTGMAIRQRSIKRMLAYSTVSQIGLVVIGIGLANTTAIIGSVVHIGGHAIMKAGLFFGAGIATSRYSASTVESYTGLADRAPLTAGAFAVLALAMVGLPPGIGFFGKWYIALGAIESELWPVAGIVVVSTLLTLAYFLRLLERMFWRPPPDTGPVETAVTSPLPDGGTTSQQPGGASANDVWNELLGDPWKVSVLILAAVLAVITGIISDHAVTLLEPHLEAVLG